MGSYIEDLIRSENARLEIAFDKSTLLFYGIIRDESRAAVVSAESNTLVELMVELDSECEEYLA